MSSNIRSYDIPIVWESYKKYKVDAANLQEAVKLALQQFLSEPDDNYLEDSFSIDETVYDNYPEEDFDINYIYEKL